MPDSPPVPPRLAVLAALAAGVLLVATGPGPAEALDQLRDGGDDPYAPLVALLVLLAQALVGWLLLTAAVTAGSHLPGAVGRALSAVARRTAPVAVRRSLEVALGLTVVAGTLGATPALAATGEVPGAAPAPVSLDWAAEPAPSPSLDWAAAPAPEPVTEQPEATPDAPAVVVQPGDSLWQLAEQDLAARGAEPTDAAVAQAWPSWWAANRDAVGDDPDLLLPGTPLERPADPPAAP